MAAERFRVGDSATRIRRVVLYGTVCQRCIMTAYKRCVEHVMNAVCEMKERAWLSGFKFFLRFSGGNFVVDTL